MLCDLFVNVRFFLSFGSKPLPPPFVPAKVDKTLLGKSFPRICQPEMLNSIVSFIVLLRIMGMNFDELSFCKVGGRKVTSFYTVQIIEMPCT